MAKLVEGPLASKVEAWLQEWWSPEQIARRLRLEYPDDLAMRVSHETIYQSLSSKAEASSAGNCTLAPAPAGHSAARKAASNIGKIPTW